MSNELPTSLLATLSLLVTSFPFPISALPLHNHNLNPRTAATIRISLSNLDAAKLVQPSISQTCTAYSPALPGDDCEAFASDWGLPITNLVAMNPALQVADNGCNDVEFGIPFWYCVVDRGNSGQDDTPDMAEVEGDTVLGRSEDEGVGGVDVPRTTIIATVPVPSLTTVGGVVFTLDSQIETTFAVGAAEEEDEEEWNTVNGHLTFGGVAYTADASLEAPTPAVDNLVTIGGVVYTADLPLEIPTTATGNVATIGGVVYTADSPLEVPTTTSIPITTTTTPAAQPTEHQHEKQEQDESDATTEKTVTLNGTPVTAPQTGIATDTTILDTLETTVEIIGGVYYTGIATTTTTADIPETTASTVTLEGEVIAGVYLGASTSVVTSSPDSTAGAALPPASEDDGESHNEAEEGEAEVEPTVYAEVEVEPEVQAPSPSPSATTIATPAAETPTTTTAATATTTLTDSPAVASTVTLTGSIVEGGATLTAVPDAVVTEAAAVHGRVGGEVVASSSTVTLRGEVVEGVLF